MLFAQLVDDAGLFPPTQLTMVDAVRRHRREAATGHGAGVLSGRFVCPASRLTELAIEASAADGAGQEVDVSAIVSPVTKEAVADALAAAAASRGIRIVAVEGPFSPGAPLPRLDGLPIFVELPVLGEWESALQATAAAGLGAKIRCGGVTADAFPTPTQLARLVRACAAVGVRFKATAGLHHAVRHTDAATGFTHHGVLNLLLATARATSGASEQDIVEVLGSTCADALVSETRSLSPEDASRTRQTFVSYGSCSTSEPVEDLRALGLIGSPT